MPKRLSKKSRRPSSDPNVSAANVLRQITGADAPPKRPSNVVPMRRVKNAAAVALGRKGGLKSAAARMEKIDPEERRRIASYAARQRWKREGGG